MEVREGNPVSSKSLSSPSNIDRRDPYAIVDDDDEDDDQVIQLDEDDGEMLEGHRRGIPGMMSSSMFPSSRQVAFSSKVASNPRTLLMPQQQQHQQQRVLQRFAPPPRSPSPPPLQQQQMQQREVECPYSCGFCTEAYAELDDLVAHLNETHLKNGLR